MIRPTMQVASTQYIHAASGTVWRKLTRLADWPAWHPYVRSASWLAEHQWTEGARFRHEVKLPLAYWSSDVATIRMAVPGSATVWEIHSVAVDAVVSVRLTDELGGTQLRMAATYHGMPVLFLLPFRTSLERRLGRILTSLKSYVEL